jgi:hypothetical protein
MNWKIWICVPVFYGLFSLWYFNWQGPLSQQEVDTFMARYTQQAGSEHTDAAVLRRFLEEDDGRGFNMLNLVQLHEEPVQHPLTGERMDSRALVNGYFEPFALRLFQRGGHPVFQARTVGGYIDSWNAENNLSFSATAMMRYRSRRDLIQLVADPAFADGHVYKLAAIERTISYPTQMMLNTALEPPAAVLLLLVLLASLTQNVTYLRKTQK